MAKPEKIITPCKNPITTSKKIPGWPALPLINWEVKKWPWYWAKPFIYIIAAGKPFWPMKNG
jgi:hypothetical protein